MAFLCARERSRSSLQFFSSVSRAFSRLNRLLIVSSAAQCVNYRAESLAMRKESRERGPALLTCTDEEGDTSCRHKNLGDDLVCVSVHGSNLLVYYHTMSSGNEICWKHCYMRLHSSAVYPLHMRVEVLRTREITSVVCGRNAEIAQKHGRRLALVISRVRITSTRMCNRYTCV